MDDQRTPPGTDPDIAARMMGWGDVTVLAPPLQGQFVSRERMVALLSVHLPDEAAPDLLHQLVLRLQLVHDEIVVNWTTGNALSILRDYGFREEQRWQGDALVSYLVWREGA